ncbi:MAG TPA: hypothetical protein VGA61_20330, partial [Anaerolineae bacterium]
MKMWRRKQRILSSALVAALLASVVLLGSVGQAVVDQNVLTNGNFESGFSNVSGCGMVGTGWGCFTNGGSVAYGFYDDQWSRVVEGQHSQLIELSTLQVAASESDRYAGIYQQVNVISGGTYQLQAKGLMRERGPNPLEDKYRYRIQWGYTADASTDWTKVSNWVELPWDFIYERTDPGGLQSFSTSLVAPSNKITLFFRVWKKWGNYNKELDVNLDSISLFGPGPVVSPVTLPVAGGVPVYIPPAANSPVVIPPAVGDTVPVIIPPPSGSNVIVIPPAGSGGGTTAPLGVAQAGTCGGPNYLRNGDFEGGFSAGVGNYWTAFNNGGMSNYSYLDDMWSQVVHDGVHAQQLQINTLNLAAADGNRVAGIYQVVGGLVPGQTYEFSLWGEMREEAANPAEDPYRYRVQWGYAAAVAGSTADNIANWTELPWNDIFVRNVGGPMSPFSVTFTAPSNSIVIGVRALKKWGTINRVLDVDVDAIRLASCQGTLPGPIVIQPCPNPCAIGQYCPPSCSYPAPVVIGQPPAPPALQVC